MKRPRWSLVAFFLFCVLFSWVTGQLASDIKLNNIREQTILRLLNGGFASEISALLDGVEAIQLPVSFSEVVETRLDGNNDGIYDSWTVTLHPGKPSEMTAIIEDKSFDGVPDTASFSTEGTLYAIREEADGLESEVQVFEISDQRPGGTQKWRYYDLDVDGDIDFMKSLTSVEGRLPIDNVWYPFLIDRGGSFKDGFWIFMSSDKTVHVLFDREKGTWGIDEQGAAAP